MDAPENPTPDPVATPGAHRCPMCNGQLFDSSRKCLSCGAVQIAPQSPPTRKFGIVEILVVLFCGAVLVSLILPAVNSHPGPSHRTQCLNNVRNLTMALQLYAQQHQAFPPAYTVDAQGRPLHSWRTLILPYFDLQGLYESIDLSKPWDAQENAAAFQTHVDVYACASAKLPSNHTLYLASVGPKAGLMGAKSRNLSEITDGAENTLLVIEVPTDRSVPWMSPQDADEALILSLAGSSKLAHSGSAVAGFCDGRVRTLSIHLPAATWRALITIAGSEEVGGF